MGDGLTVKQAADVAAKFAMKMGWSQLVEFGGGRARAANLEAGCDMPVGGLVADDVMVEAVKLRKMLAAIGDAAAVRLVGKGKLRKLEIKGGGSTFTLQIVAEADHPGFPEIPDGPWTAVSAAEARALLAVSSQAQDEESGGQYQIAGVRLGGGWAYALATWGGLRAAVPATASMPPVTIQRVAFDGLNGDVEVASDAGKAFVREVATGQVRWTALLEGEHPGRVLDEAAANARARAKCVVTVSASELILLCKQAQVDGSPGHRLESSGELVTLRSGKAGPADFVGTMASKPFPGAPVEESNVGVRTAILAAMLQSVAGATAQDEVVLAIGGPTDPITIEATSPEGHTVTGVLMALTL